jgi:hypothetical protein
MVEVEVLQQNDGEVVNDAAGVGQPSGKDLSDQARFATYFAFQVLQNRDGKSLLLKKSKLFPYSANTLVVPLVVNLVRFVQHSIIPRGPNWAKAQLTRVKQEP